MFELSDDQETWAHFGTFYSGLLTPFLSFLAFCGILFTVVLQARQLDLAKTQLDDAKKQGEIEEFQRVLAGAGNNLNMMLNAKGAFHEAKRFIVLGNPDGWTLGAAVAAFGSQSFKAKQLQPKGGFDMTRLDALRADLNLPLIALVSELESLAWCMNTYRSMGGSKDVLAFYTHRYAEFVGWCEILDKFSKESWIYSAFDVQRIVESLVRPPAAPQPNAR